jgi:hypothetical protein
MVELTHRRRDSFRKRSRLHCLNYSQRLWNFLPFFPVYAGNPQQSSRACSTQEVIIMALRPRHRSWTDEETGRLRSHIAGGGSAARAAVMFRRTQGAVRAHAATCGLKFPTISELRRRASGAPIGARFDRRYPAHVRNE